MVIAGVLFGGSHLGQTVLTVGCYSATYAIPAAERVGEKGTVDAVNTDPSKRKKLKDVCNSKGLEKNKS